MRCPTCEAELTIKPKGISKAGNPYDAFFGHPMDSKCKERVEMSEEDQKKVNLNARAKKFDAELTKFKGMAWFNATNAAVELLKGAIVTVKPGVKTKEEISSGEDTFRVKLAEHRDWFYKESLEFFVREIINEQ